MAGVAVSAASAWKLQKKNEMARETYEFVLDMHDTMMILILALVDARRKSQKPHDYESLKNGYSEKIENIYAPTKYISLSQWILKEPDLAIEIKKMQERAAIVIDALIDITNSEPRDRPPNYLRFSHEITKAHKELIEEKGLSKFKEECEKYLLKYF